MGLDTTHGAFSGAYSAFNRFRQSVAMAIGGSFPPHNNTVHVDGTPLEPNMWYWGDGYGPETHPGLHAFLNHSDCDGELTPEECRAIEREMSLLLPELDSYGLGAGHIEDQGGYRRVAEKFIAGCKAAADAGESVVFH